tara:strand:- start:11228 stop:12112 length:885 start_codon:yes stop_codon:yes gene_type:complete
MILVTGAKGFIGSVMVRYLNSIGITDIVIVDDVLDVRNLKNTKYTEEYPISIDASRILPKTDIRGVFHFGAISNTLERDARKIEYYNVQYTKVLAEVCKQRSIPMVFSSSAAVYGHGRGPVNQYAQSKLDSEREISDNAICLRFFNVYGPNEYHKGRMSSVILKWYKELKQTGQIKIFENSDDYKRDFIYVDDVCRVAYNAFAYTKFANTKSGVYDLGTGVSNSFETIADCVIRCFGSGEKKYIPMPMDLQEQYQRNTKANIEPIVSLGWGNNFTTISEGVDKYFRYLVNEQRI